MTEILVNKSLINVSGNIITAIITSDFQVRTRWGWMGFENEYWDKSNWKSLLYPNKRVDINHKRNNTVNSYLIAISDKKTLKYKRKQANWKHPKTMDYVLGTILIPKNTMAQKFVMKSIQNTGTIGISIEHGGRKPKRTIGKYITLTNRPWNSDCWGIFGIFNNEKVFLYPKTLPKEIEKEARNQIKKLLN